MIEGINFLFGEIYRILFVLIPVLVSVAMIVWFDRRVWGLVQKEEVQMLWVHLDYFKL